MQDSLGLYGSPFLCESPGKEADLFVEDARSPHPLDDGPRNCQPTFLRNCFMFVRALPCEHIFLSVARFLLTLYRYCLIFVLFI